MDIQEQIDSKRVLLVFNEAMTSKICVLAWILGGIWHAKTLLVLPCEHYLPKSWRSYMPNPTIPSCLLQVGTPPHIFFGKGKNNLLQSMEIVSESNRFPFSWQ